jgi:metal-responsive CopG/Arc/MetJ family transcriptional regulator
MISGMTAVKVTLSLPKELLTVVDRYVAAHPGATRSGVCADALLEWLRGQQDAEIEDYYRTLSGPERAEDAAWAAMAGRSAERLWP